jgi:hypothetical protein
MVTENKNNIGEKTPTIIFITHVVPYPPAAGNEITGTA